MVIAYCVHQHHIAKILFAYKQTNDRSSNTVTATLLFWGLLRVTQKWCCQRYRWVTWRNPGSGWRTDIYPIEEPGVTRGITLEVVSGPPRHDTVFYLINEC